MIESALRKPLIPASVTQVELEGAGGGRGSQAEGSELSSAQDIDKSEAFSLVSGCHSVSRLLCA